MNRIEYWKKNPDKFVEEVYGIELFPFQKIILKKMAKHKHWYILFR